MEHKHNSSFIHNLSFFIYQHMTQLLGLCYKKIHMNKLLLTTVCLILATTISYAQITFPPGGPNRKAKHRECVLRAARGPNREVTSPWR